MLKNTMNMLGVSHPGSQSVVNYYESARVKRPGGPESVIKNNNEHGSVKPPGS